MSGTKRITALLMALMLLFAALPAYAARGSGEPTATPDPFPKPTRPADVAEYDKEHPEDLQSEQLWSWSAILIEADSGMPIFEKSADDVRYPASTTKIMTVLLAILMLDDLDFDVTCSESAVAVNYTGEDISSLKLEAGEVINFEDLLYGTMLISANDGANVIAETVCGSVDNFVALMNEAAVTFGCTNTHFANPHGLHDDNHYTTPRDMAIIARVAMQNDTFRAIVGTRSYTMARTNVHRARTVTNTNELFDPGTEEKANRYFYPDANGVKTGFTNMAQYCFVGSAERDGVALISVIMYAGDNSRWADTIKLMDYGFSQYTSVTPIDLYNRNPITIETSGYSLNDDGMGKLPLNCVAQDRADANRAKIIATHDEVDTMANNLRSLVLIQYTRDFVAPVEAGEVMGTMTWFPDEGEPVVYNLIASRAIARRENAPKTLEEIVAETESDPNPLPPLTFEVVVLLALPLLIAVALVALLLRLIFGRKKRRHGKTPDVKHRYLR